MRSEVAQETAVIDAVIYFFGLIRIWIYTNARKVWHENIIQQAGAELCQAQVKLGRVNNPLPIYPKNYVSFDLEKKTKNI